MNWRASANTVMRDVRGDRAVQQGQSATIATIEGQRVLNRASGENLPPSCPKGRPDGSALHSVRNPVTKTL